MCLTAITIYKKDNTAILNRNLKSEVQKKKDS